MGEEERAKPAIVPLDKKQKGAILDDLNKKGATFFTSEGLQKLNEIFGIDAKLSVVQKALKKRSDVNR